MAQLYTKRPDHWLEDNAQNTNSKSVISEYQSGKVQKNISNQDAVEQEILDANEKGLGQRRVIQSSKQIKDITDANLEINEEANKDIEQRSNSSNTNFLANEKYQELAITNADKVDAQNSFTEILDHYKVSSKFESMMMDADIADESFDMQEAQARETVSLDAYEKELLSFSKKGTKLPTIAEMEQINAIKVFKAERVGQKK